VISSNSRAAVAIYIRDNGTMVVTYGDGGTSAEEIVTAVIQATE
jgi:hypothetical protein